jgi:hypothetical protein
VVFSKASENIFTMKKFLPFIILFITVGIFFFPFFAEHKLPVPSDALVGLYHPWRDLYADEYPRGMPFKNFLITDPIRQQIPWRKIAIDELKQGRLPLWNPYSFAGTPLLGNIQSGALYPFNIVFFLFSFPIAWSILIMLQPLLAGIFLYVYLLSKKLHPWACSISSIAWAFSGFSIAWLTWGTIVHTALWLPLILFCIDKGKRSIFRLLLLGIILSCSFFAGHTQIFLYCFLCALGYAVFRKKTGFFIVSALIFGGITFFQWKEVYSLLIHSSRVVEANLMAKEGWFMPWQHLIQFVIPDFFGNPATLNYWGTWNYAELVGYIGILPLFFAFTGLRSHGFLEKKYWVFILGVSLLLLLPTPLAKLPYHYQIPFFSALQPTRLLVLVIFSLVILSAYGFHTMFEKKELSLAFPLGIFICIFSVAGVIAMYLDLNVSLRNMVFPLVIFLTGSVALLFRKRQKFQIIIIGSIFVLVAFDMLRFGRKFTPFTDISYFFPNTKILSFLQSQEKPFRVLAADDRILPPNTASYYGIEMASGYDPLYSKYFEAILSAHNGGAKFNRILVPSLAFTSVFDLFQIRYVLTYGPHESPNLSFVMNEGDTYVYEVVSSLPRFYFVKEVIEASSMEDSVKRLFEDINLKNQAVILGNVTISSDSLKKQERVFVKQYDSSEIILEATAILPRYLVILNSYFPGWQAYINGSKVKMFQTNGSFMGLVVPEGTHTITLVYEG